MSRLFVIKVGGNIIDDDISLAGFLRLFAAIKDKKILVHGGGKLATRLAADLGVKQTMVEGRRITDRETLRIVTMVYAGYVNKNIVAALQAKGCNAIGLTGADGDSITAHKRAKGNIDYGYAGDIDRVNAPGIATLLDSHDALVFAPITHDKKGQLLNTNADTIAQEIATALSASFEVQLVYGFEKAGVLLDANDDSTVIPVLEPLYYQKLKEDSKIFAGMIPKIDNAYEAINRGVSNVLIGKAEELDSLVEGRSGTKITNVTDQTKMR
jgi:acetylglutamate kinase